MMYSAFKRPIFWAAVFFCVCGWAMLFVANRSEDPAIVLGSIVVLLISFVLFSIGERSAP